VVNFSNLYSCRYERSKTLVSQLWLHPQKKTTVASCWTKKDQIVLSSVFSELPYSAHLTQWPLWTSIMDWVVPRRSWRHRLPTSVPTTASPTFFYQVQPSRWTVDHPHRPGGRSLIYPRSNLQSAVTTHIPAGSYIPPMIPIGRRTWKVRAEGMRMLDWLIFFVKTQEWSFYS
jgi:hypothetical protein